ncbi:bolA-like protein 3 [Nerophis lumbriciformis]|uniref:bolA-like protein 3 n=1 Tax=Nerophis lumbriciformis TaxID=546530 RepID=UPI002ADFF594|nr:bolA-like protein 3 [Nerophis lumbriciformis]
MLTMLAGKGTSFVISALRIVCRSKAVLGQPWRCLSTQTDGEVRIAKILKEKFPLASSLKVVDISGGCGAMYEVHIESSEFKDKRTIQQHQLVNQALKEEIQGMHGLRIFTDIPK